MQRVKNTQAPESSELATPAPSMPARVGSSVLGQRTRLEPRPRTGHAPEVRPEPAPRKCEECSSSACLATPIFLTTPPALPVSLSPCAVQTCGGLLGS